MRHVSAIGIIIVAAASFSYALLKPLALTIDSLAIDSLGRQFKPLLPQSIHLTVEVDSQPLSDTICFKQNSFGAVLQAYTAAVPANQWLHQGIAYALRTIGTPHESLAPDLQISFTLTKVRSTAYHYYEADVWANCSVKHSGKVVLNKAYAGYGNAGANIANRQSEFGKALQSAQKDLLHQFLADLHLVVTHDTLLSDIPCKAVDIASVLTLDPSQAVFEPGVPLDSIFSPTFRQFPLNDFSIISANRKTIARLDSSANALHRKRLDLEPSSCGKIGYLVTISASGEVSAVQYFEAKSDDIALNKKITELILKTHFVNHSGNQVSFVLTKNFVKRSNIAGKITLGVFSLTLGVLSLILTMRNFSG